MLFKDRIKNLTTFYPELSRVWIKTGDPKMPLKSVWISESALKNMEEGVVETWDAENNEVAEDHLWMAA